MWKCQKCGERIEDTFETCWSCGTGKDGSPPENPSAFEEGKKAAITTKQQQPTSEPEEPEEYFCTGCSAKVQYEDNVCPSCGANISEIESETQSATLKDSFITERKAPGVVAVTALFGLFAIGSALYGCLHEPSYEERALLEIFPALGVQKLIGIFAGFPLGFAYLVGAFMTHQGEIKGLVVLNRSLYASILLSCIQFIFGMAYLPSTQSAGQTGLTVGIAIGAAMSIVIAALLMRAVDKHIDAWPALPLASAKETPAPRAGGLSEELTRLSQLRAQGALTDEEYAQAKAKLLKQ